MSTHSCFRVALKALYKNGLQTALTILGLIVGVATVLAMFALGNGAQVAIENQARAAGMNTITVASGNHFGTVEDDTQAGNVDEREIDSSDLASAPAQEQKSATAVVETPASALPAARKGDPKGALGVIATLAVGDAEAIAAIPGVEHVSRGVHTNTKLGFGSSESLASVHGDDVALAEIRRVWKFEDGRFYNRAEQDKAAQVIVLGSVLAERVFGKQKAVGQTVALWNQPFEVVGVVGSGSWMVAAGKGDDQFDAAYVPFTTVHRLLDIDVLSDITLAAATAGDVTRVVKSVTAVLRKRHGLDGPGQREDFTVTSQARKAISAGGMRREMAKALTGNMDVLDKVTLEQMNKTLQRASRTMTALLASVAAASLLVGGIGVMNTMLLSVTQRTGEIGLRRAMGARSGDILRQFLMEAAVLSMSGGLAGIALGLSASFAITHWIGWATSISPLAVLLAFGSSATVGIFFGYYPARQASALTPMESLRHE